MGMYVSHARAAHADVAFNGSYSRWSMLMDYVRAQASGCPALRPLFERGRRDEQGTWVDDIPPEVLPPIANVFDEIAARTDTTKADAHYLRQFAVGCRAAAAAGEALHFT